MRFQTLYEARWIFAALVLLGVASCFISLWLLLPILLLFIYTISFFRDPDRVAPADSDAVLAAADGTVADIVEIEETEVLNARRGGSEYFFPSSTCTRTARRWMDASFIERAMRDFVSMRVISTAPRKTGR